MIDSIMSLPPVNATTVALNNSPPGTTELFGKMILGVGATVAVVCLGAVAYSKLNPANNSANPAPAKGGARRTRRMRRANNRTRKI
jgi:hypothetical protein